MANKIYAKNKGNFNEILKVIGKRKINSSHLNDIKKEWKKWQDRYM